MLHSKVHIEAGDLVIVYLARDNMSSIVVTPGEVFHNKFGKYRHDDMIGMKFGSKMHSPPPNNGYLHLLRPTPELWTLSLPHRTQILYIADIAYITSKLGIRPGSRAIEAGTGSGSMTHALARGVGSRGKVYSFEYHQTRYEKAQEEFTAHGLDNVQLRHRNVCKDGFEGAEDVNAVFLDLPAPWEAIPHAIKTFKADTIGRICCFSPCLEQVLKTVSTLRSEGFHDISTHEVSIRNHELATYPSNAQAPFRLVSTIKDGLKEREQRREARRIIQMKTAREKARKKKEAEATAAAAAAADIEEVSTPAVVNEDAAESSAHAAKRKLGELEGAALEAEGASKHAKLDPTEATDAPSHGAGPVESGTPNANGHVDEEEAEELEETEEPGSSNQAWTEPDNDLRRFALTRPSAEMRGHTSYLTFACYYPQSIRHSLETQEEKRPTHMRIAELGDSVPVTREGSVATTEYGDESLDQAMGTLTEEELMSMAKST